MSEQKQKDAAIMEEVTLSNDTGANLSFRGRLYAENSFYDEDTGTLTQQKLYITEKGQQAYSIVTSDGKNKERRAYLIKREGRLCKINNGLFDVTVNAHDLVTAVRGLCGIQENMQYEDFFGEDGVDEAAANG